MRHANRLDSRATARMMAQDDNRAMVSAVSARVTDIAAAKYRKADTGETLVWDTVTRVWRRF